MWHCSWNANQHIKIDGVNFISDRYLKKLEEEARAKAFGWVDRG